MVDNSFHSEDNNSFVVAIQKYSKGVFIASNRGECALWVRSEENNSTSGKQNYDWIKTWQPMSCKNQKILGLALDQNEEYLGVCLANNNIGMVNIKSIGLNEEKAAPEVNFDLICKGFHSGAITTIDVAVQRPILVTCSREDQTLRLWNYITGECEYAREFYVRENGVVRGQARPLVTVAIHPSGY